MGATTEISWTHSTFNPWWGCAKVSPGCTNCYAETFSRRVGLKVWGQGGERRVFGEKHWNEPRKWNRDAEKAGERRRVFCASMADVFEDHPIAEQERPKLWRLIEETPWLDWLLLTKRPENHEMVPLAWQTGSRRPGNLWFGTTAENQPWADKRIPHLLAAPWPAVRFVSAEPLLGALHLDDISDGRGGVLKPLVGLHWEPTSIGLTVRKPKGPRIDWVIVGGESGPKARPFALEWASSIVEQCRAAGVAPFVKQLGDDPWIGGGPGPGDDWRLGGRYGLPTSNPAIVGRLKPKGGDITEFPPDLQVRDFPEAVRK